MSDEGEMTEMSLGVEFDFNDEMVLMMGAWGNHVGRNDRYLKLRIKQLEAKERTADEQSELEKHRVEFGMTREGGKKPKVCWHFVHNGRCEHGFKMKEAGGVRGGRWHPGIEEATYLKKKTSAKVI